jgi:hypothetical protein
MVPCTRPLGTPPASSAPGLIGPANEASLSDCAAPRWLPEDQKRASDHSETLLACKFWSGRRDLNPRPLDPQDGGPRVIPAQSVFFVRAHGSPTCGLFSA